jgi:hypothetical protein
MLSGVHVAAAADGSSDGAAALALATGSDAPADGDGLSPAVHAARSVMMPRMAVARVSLDMDVAPCGTLRSCGV